MTREEIISDINRAFRWSCQEGNLSMAKWLVQRTNMRREEIMNYSNYAFRLSCTKGHLSVAKWLVEITNMTREEIIGDANLVFRLSCEKGNLSMAKWLAEITNMSREEMKKWDISSYPIEIKKWIQHPPPNFNDYVLPLLSIAYALILIFRSKD